MMTSKTITTAQSDRIADLVREAAKTAIDKTLPTSGDAQRGIISNGREFKNRVEEKVREIILEMTGFNEEVHSGYRYPVEYEGPSPIQEQIVAISNIFGINAKHALAYAKKLPKLPEGAEGWFAIPKVSALAKRYFLEASASSEKYCMAVSMAHKKLANSRPFRSLSAEFIDSTMLRQNAVSLAFIHEHESFQKGDIIIIAAQFGYLHRGRSIGKVRERLAKNEFGLDSFTLCCMILANPNIFVNSAGLNIDCPGDDYDFERNGRFNGSTLYLCSDDEEDSVLLFGTDSLRNASGQHGSATAFLPI